MALYRRSARYMVTKNPKKQTNIYKVGKMRMKKLEQGKALSYLAEQEKNTLFTLCEESEESFSLCGLHVTPVTYTEEQMEAFRLVAKDYEIVCVKESDELSYMDHTHDVDKKEERHAPDEKGFVIRDGALYGFYFADSLRQEVEVEAIFAAEETEDGFTVHGKDHDYLYDTDSKVDPSYYEDEYFIRASLVCNRPKPEKKPEEKPEEKPEFSLYVSKDKECVELTGYNGAGGAVRVPDGVTEVYGYVFQQNDQITELVFPDSLRRMKEETGWELSCLRRLVLPAGEFRCVPKYGFSRCRALTEVVIPPNVTAFEMYSFSNCDSLETLSVGRADAPLHFEQGAFKDCAALRSLTVRANGRWLEPGLFIGSDAFKDCAALETVTVYGNVSEVRKDAFSRSPVKHLVFPEGLRHLWWELVEACAATLEDISAPAADLEREAALLEKYAVKRIAL